MQKQQAPFTTILIWGIVAVAMALVLAFCGAICISKGIIPEEMIGLLAAAIAAISVFITSIIALKGQGKTKLQVAVGVVAVYLLFCVAGKALFFRGSSDNIWAIIIACLVSAVAALVVSTTGKGRRKTTVRRRR